MDGLVLPGTPYDGSVKYYDRSFDLRYQVLSETHNRPAVAVGLRDFMGTGLYGGEYIVATKSITPTLRLTGGLGWGRLGSHGSIGSLGSRPTKLKGQGGIPNYDRWFRGEFAPFGGLTWTPTDRLAVKLEYSSDAYTREVDSGIYEHKTPWNVGLSYRMKNGGQLSVYSLNGNEIGAQITFHTNPRIAAVAGGRERAPVPVGVRARGSMQDLGWTQNDVAVANTKTVLSKVMKAENLALEGVELTGRTATVRLHNYRYGAEPQAIGRTARIMTQALPASVETFVIVPVVNGMATSSVTLKRSDLEQLENAPATAILDRAVIGEGRGMAPRQSEGLYPKFKWSLSPYLSLSVFDPNNPVRADAGLRLQGEYSLSPNLVVSGAITKKLVGNLEDTKLLIEPGRTLPRVRTDQALYSREGDPALEHLTVTAYGRPGRNLYSRLTLGYLESMYAGVSGEVLWKPVDSRLALGAELNYVKQRDFDQLFGLQDYDVFTGHVSAYYDFGNGFHGQLDVGRYLAGDYGATVSLDREFKNGWRVGAFATFTDVDYDDFGEGSFDKGIRVTIPIGHVTGTPSRTSTGLTIQSLTRDGGARVNVRDRLYTQIRGYHRADLEGRWGRFWR